MKKIFLTATVLFLLTMIADINAQSRPFGLGLVLGDPTGITAKLWINQKNAFSFVLGWSSYGRYYHDDRCYDPGFYRNNRSWCDDRFDNYGYDSYGQNLHLHADYLIHDFSIIKSPHGIPLYFGPGLNMNLWDYQAPQIGLRGVGGIAFIPRGKPIDIFLELALILQVFPRFWTDLDGGVGIRYYF
jgi:hypothetical protein